MNKVITKILENNGFFYGGFVRDYLIRGEKFSDIDYIFSEGLRDGNNFKIIYQNNGLIFDLLNMTGKQYIDKYYFHRMNRIYFYDISCNLFGFDKDGFFPLPSFHTFDLNKSWELILKKKFYKLCDGELTTRKMILSGWKMVGEISDKQKQIIKHERSGIWNNYNQLAMQRLNELND